MTTPRPLLLGHRGARAVKSIPENTVGSFDRALAAGSDGFEFDVRLTVDGVPVICHDPKFNAIEIAQASAQQLASLPKLEDVLVRYHDRAFLDIELKVAGIEQITLDLLRKHLPTRGYVVSSFLPEVLTTAYAEAESASLGLICETKTQLQRWSELPIDYVIPHHKLATPDLISKLQAVGKKILVWTVNQPADMRRFADAKVDGLISDDPGLLHQTLAG